MFESCSVKNRTQSLRGQEKFLIFPTSHGIILSFSGPQVNSNISKTVMICFLIEPKINEDSTVISQIVITNFFVK